jgi:hypothetical protein
VPHGRSARVRKVSSPSGFDPRIVQLLGSRYTGSYPVKAVRPRQYVCVCVCVCVWHLNVFGIWTQPSVQADRLPFQLRRQKDPVPATRYTQYGRRRIKSANEAVRSKEKYTIVRTLYEILRV